MSKDLISVAGEILAAPLEATRARLRELLMQRAVKTGDFTLASGRKSTYYVDGKMVTLEPEGLFCLSRLMLDILHQNGINAAGGPTLGADPIVGGISLLSHLVGPPISAFIVRKEAKGHGTGKRIEGQIPDAARVAIVEDVVTTGASLLRAVEAVKEETTGQVILVSVLLDREEGGTEAIRDAGLNFFPLFTKSELGL
jgi:orotate phosphoribosyltransferase